MGTQASMVMTLMKDEQLWGLIACHHHAGPKHVPYEVRLACEFLANMVTGIGLAGMRERVRELGGQLRIESDSGGTCVTVAVNRLSEEQIERSGDNTAA